MANIPRPRTTTVATALLAGSAVAAAALLARRRAETPRAAIQSLELTPSHRCGTGTPLLLLHGVGAIWRAWSPVVPHLESHHDVIVPTLAGHGGGPPLDPDVAPSVQALADALEAELDALGLQKVHIAGNSLGGWLGMELARRGRARSLVLFSPAGAWRSQRSIEARAAAIRLSVGGLGRCAPRADAIAANALLRWPLLAGQVAHPNRVPPRGVGGLHPGRRCRARRRATAAADPASPGRTPARRLATTPSGWFGATVTGCCLSTVSVRRCSNGFPGRS